MKTRYRRNMVVTKTRDTWHYGRIVRVLDDDMYEIVDCGKYKTIYHHDEITPQNYKGCYVWGHEPDNWAGKPVRYSFMPTLRKLKIMCSIYQADMWRKPPFRYEGKETDLIDFASANDALYDIINEANGGQRVRNRYHWFGKLHKATGVFSRYVNKNFGMMGVYYNNKFKPKRLYGRNWAIEIARDYSNQCRVLYGEVADIKCDLLIVKMSQ